jgi:hypothetical protein
MSIDKKLRDEDHANTLLVQSPNILKVLGIKKVRPLWGGRAQADLSLHQDMVIESYGGTCGAAAIRWKDPYNFKKFGEFTLTSKNASGSTSESEYDSILADYYIQGYLNPAKSAIACAYLVDFKKFKASSLYQNPDSRHVPLGGSNRLQWFHGWSISRLWNEKFILRHFGDLF